MAWKLEPTRRAGPLRKCGHDPPSAHRAFWCPSAGTLVSAYREHELSVVSVPRKFIDLGPARGRCSLVATDRPARGVACVSGTPVGKFPRMRLTGSAPRRMPTASYPTATLVREMKTLE